MKNFQVKMVASLFMFDSHFQVITKLSGPLRFAAEKFNPSEYIIPVDQPKPVVTIIENNHACLQERSMKK